MKTKEEIDELYHKYWDDFSSKYDDNLHYYSFVEGYTQCQEDIANKYRESKFREAKAVIEAFIKGYSKCQEDNDWTKGCECESSIGQTWCCNQCGLPHDTMKSKITRFEVIDEKGRAYTTKDCKVELSCQDDGRTLKVFIKSIKKQD